MPQTLYGTVGAFHGTARVRRAVHKAVRDKLGQALSVPVQTLARWRHWWVYHFPSTPLWRANGARFMPPVTIAEMPAALLKRFVHDPPGAVVQLLVFLSPLSVRQ